MKVDLSNISVRELRDALNGPGEMTLAEALLLVRAGPEQAAEHARQESRYRQFLEDRDTRRQSAIRDARQAALAEVEEIAKAKARSDGFASMQTHGIHSLAPEAERQHAATEAANETAREFDIRWPEIDMPTWTDAGEPAVYEAGAIKRTITRVKEMAT